MNPDTNWKELKHIISSKNALERREALFKIKDAVIGSNRQKGALISADVVPELLEIICSTTEELADKMNALIILGSLAKGSTQQVQELVQRYNIVRLLVKEIILKNNSDSKSIEVCLSIMRSIYEQPYSPVDFHLIETCPITYFLSLASAESSLKTQICVTSILVSICQTHEDQMRLLHAGTIPCLARMICTENELVQIPALRCLSCMSYSNRSVTDNICVTSYQGRSLPDILNALLSRLYMPDIQLTAARCLTYIYRSGTLLSTDYRILHKALPSLTRLCSDNFDISIRVDAADTLAYLIEIDSQLQQTAAISNHLLKSLPQLLCCHNPARTQAALRCYASLCANDEAIRIRIMDTTSLIEPIMDSLTNDDSQVRLASIRCLHSLSRSVQQLRTTFQDNTVWKPLMNILTYETQNTSTDFLQAITSTICNLLLEFSPSKEHLLIAGIMPRLCCLAHHKDPAVRLNGVWALMNMTFQASHSVKTDIFNYLGVLDMVHLLSDSDTLVIMKTLGLLRNMLRRTVQNEQIMGIYSKYVWNAVNMLLESNHTSEIKEQALAVVGNIADNIPNIDVVLDDKKLMSHICEYLLYADSKLQAGALYVINNIVQRNDTWSDEKYARLEDVVKKVHELQKKVSQNKAFYEDYIHRTIKKIIAQCNKILTKVVN